MPPPASVCPHCGRPSLYPNVEAAADEEERQSLERRYQSAKMKATVRGAANAVQSLEMTIAANSHAVLARSAIELHRLATSDKQLYATYYGLIGAGVRLPEGEKWDILRGVTDSALFPNYKEHIRFAALSLDGVGVQNYGECSIVLRDVMIAHRASVFEENSVLFMDNHNIKVATVHNLPKGYRATWEDRAKLCVTKLSDSINATTQADEFPGLLLRQGATSEDDDFIEVHIWGPMTVLTFEQVTIRPRARRGQHGIIKALNDKLAKFGVTVKVQ